MILMKELFQYAYECLAEGEGVVLVTVVEGTGSIPRGAGAMMVAAHGDQNKVTALGSDDHAGAGFKHDSGGENFRSQFMGTIGGGAVEFEAQQISLEALKNEASLIREFHLSPNEAADLGMICGGDIAVYFQYIAPTMENQYLVKSMLGFFQENTDRWLVLKISQDSSWEMCVSSVYGKIECSTPGFSCSDLNPLLKPESVLIKQNAFLWYGQPLVRAGRVCVFGGGHIAQELVPVLARVGFPSTVIDDREEFCGKTLFPQAEETVCGEFTAVFDKLFIGPPDYIVIITRGHLYDYEVLARALRTSARYIGMVGSSKKIDATFDRLVREEGFGEEDLERVFAPIGLSIGGETPAEIAVSIAAQLIQVRSLKNDD